MHLFPNHAADLLARDQQGLIMQCDDALSGRAWVEAWVAGETIHVRLEILEKMESTLGWVEDFRTRLERERKQHLYRVRVRRPVEFIPYLDVLLEPAPHMVEHREQRRLHHHVRVMSPDLPDYRGTVRDLSEGGVGLDLVGPLRVGARLQLRLEPDGAKDIPFDLEAEVCWCRATTQEGTRAHDESGRAHAYEVGARFLTLSDKASIQLRDFLDRVSHLEDVPIHDVGKLH